MKKRTLFFRIGAIVILLAIAAVMMVIGRGHTVYFDNKKLEYNGETYDTPYKVCVYVNDERVAKLYDKERGMAKMCIRDRDARGDRSPGEFYQLDMEMAFATQDDVFAILEDVLPPIFAQFGKYNIASSAPFRRIGYVDALETYGLSLIHISQARAAGYPPFYPLLF